MTGRAGARKRARASQVDVVAPAPPGPAPLGGRREISDLLTEANVREALRITLDQTGGLELDPLDIGTRADAEFVTTLTDALKTVAEEV